MDVEIAADAVAGAVIEIGADLPQGMTRQRVELRARRAGWEPAGGKRDMPLEDAGEAVARLVARRADRDRPRHVGRAVEILGAGIEEIERARREPLLALGRCTVMHDRAVPPRAPALVKPNIPEI